MSVNRLKQSTALSMTAIFSYYGMLVFEFQRCNQPVQFLQPLSQLYQYISILNVLIRTRRQYSTQEHPNMDSFGATAKQNIFQTPNFLSVRTIKLLVVDITQY